jgi:hypothetical protein
LIDSTSCGLIREARPLRPVGEATGEDGGLAGPTLTPEHAAGDLARGVHALLDVDRQREEVDALARLAGDDRAQDGRVAHPHEHRAIGLGRELARLQGHLEAGRIDRATDTDCVRHGNALLSHPHG